MSIEELEAGFRGLAVRIYGQEETRWRRDNFNRKYLRHPEAVLETSP